MGHTQSWIFLDLALFSIYSQSYYDIGLGGDGTNPNF